MPACILAIETATTACSAALLVDGDIRERYALAPRQHATLILPMIESLLVEAGIAVAQLDAVAFGRGPGSFTGVRIAASIVQGIAFAAERPVLPVSTLAALALGGQRETGQARVLAALDARKDEVYWGSYLHTDAGTLELQGEEVVCAAADIAVPAAGDWVGVGSGWDSYGPALLQRLGDRVVRVMPDLEPRAMDVAHLSVDAFEQGRAVSPEQAIPVYLRNNVADVKRT
ncbi:MAG: tRNA (adenosine(37)-N6)-threonylcarbamoyltransferase complex dimerization subunit type 1 TsaB [Gammaproteobacteria bacterium]|nr:tRNA (adenosine(37)-N6)-threonylcarbamoyltransferase complex dimerization subunit type 1 TsaB [Gammaproteobacteria bacterium]